MPSLHNTDNKYIETSDSLTSDSQASLLVSKGNENDKISLGIEDTLDNDVVWKQMGTAKGKGRLYKGGRWLKDIEVNMGTKSVTFHIIIVFKFLMKLNRLFPFRLG